MKMSKEDYTLLKESIDKSIERIGINSVLKYKSLKLGNDVEKRFRWDLLNSSSFNTSKLPSYLNDNHIDSALKYYVKNNPLLQDVKNI